ncbi:TIGR02281 family clan AA aspartic protease [Sphingomonas bacterium]|uniref:retropepsin-like aspartic protease family protein n=1 Tax=Sphingomonas bacterium TaxID=1895847 RepID=UPI0020C669B1|nr:TIGR02281 family clan AA aspartic protease [Sphingomonas bacterium]
MTAGRAADIAFACVLLILPLSALIARRVPIGRTLKMAAAWLTILAIGLLIVSERGRFTALTGLLSDQHFDGSTTRIAMGEDGHFHADVVVNGVKTTMLVDSGATTTALSEATAKAAGITLDERPFPVVLDTANGPIAARAATARLVTVGSIRVADLPVVVSPAFGDADAIGMNFLSRLASWRVDGRTLVLEPKTK